MKHACQILMTAFASLLLVAAVWALPPAAHSKANAHGFVAAQAGAQTQSVSGKIASVAKTSFTLEVTSGQGAAQKPEAAKAQPNDPRTMTFEIDQNTTIEGKLKVGANAQVTYRQNSSGQNVAISVHVD